MTIIMYDLIAHSGFPNLHSFELLFVVVVVVVLLWSKDILHPDTGTADSSPYSLFIPTVVYSTVQIYQVGVATVLSRRLFTGISFRVFLLPTATMGIHPDILHRLRMLSG